VSTTALLHANLLLFTLLSQSMPYLSFHLSWTVCLEHCQHLLLLTPSCAAAAAAVAVLQDEILPPVMLQSCVLAPLYEPMPDAAELDADSQLERVRAAMQESSPSKPCRAAAEVLCGSSSLPLFVELGVSRGACGQLGS
jgi:hypothetical protein